MSIDRPQHSLKKTEDPPPTVYLGKDFPEYDFVLNWDFDRYDLDAVAFLLGPDGTVANRSAGSVVFYNQRTSSDKSTSLSGDNREGGAEGETIRVSTKRVSPDVKMIVFAATIYDPNRVGYQFGMVGNARVEIYGLAPVGTRVFKGSFDLTHQSARVTGLVYGMLSRLTDGWEFTVLNEGYSGGIIAIGNKYGVTFTWG